MEGSLMRKAVLLVGIIAWSIMGLLILGVLTASLSGAGMPDWVRGLPGIYGGEGDNMIIIGGSVELIKEESFSLDGIGSLGIHASSHRITVTLGSGDKLTVRQYDFNNAAPFTSDAGGGALTIRADRTISLLNFRIGINQSPRLDITVPLAYAGDVSLATNSGSIMIEDRAAWGDTKLKTSSGTIRLTAPAVFKDLEMKTSSGSVRTEKIEASSITSETASGSQRLGDIEAGGQVLIKSSSGSVSTASIKAIEVSVATSSGSQNHGDIEADGMIRLTSNSGSVRAGAVRSSEHHIRTSSGSVRVGELTGTRNIESRSGSVRVG
jgi:hypothetical protein